MAKDNSRGGRLVLAYVSPLPPVRSGISDYSVDLLPLLENYASVAVVRVPGQEVSLEVRRRFRPVLWKEATADPSEAGRLGVRKPVPLFQMGNNRHHEEIRDLALAHPGIVTLHDVWLHHLLVERTLASGDMTSYVAELTACHGWVGGAVALPRRWSAWGDAPMFALPANRVLLERQAGILVHSEWAAETVREELGGAARVRPVPMPMPAPALDASLDEKALRLRDRYGIPQSATVLGSFGFQTPIKRTRVVVEALADPRLADVWLLIGGEVSPGQGLMELAREHGVAERVQVTGFLSDEDFAPAIRATDLCVNLRYPTAGETSASLLRIFALGRGAVVSDYAQFAQLDDRSVVKIPLPAVAQVESGEGGGGGEVRALASAVAELLADSGRIEASGRAARELIERQHDPDAAARAMVEAIEELLDEEREHRAGGNGEPGGRGGFTPRRPTSLTWTRPAAELRFVASDSSDEQVSLRWDPGTRRTFVVRLTNTGFCRLLAGRRGAGGIALAIALLDGSGCELEHRPWLRLPRDLDPGESYDFEIELRRPLGAVRLSITAHVVEGALLAGNARTPIIASTASEDQDPAQLVSQLEGAWSAGSAIREGARHAS